MVQYGGTVERYDGTVQWYNGTVRWYGTVVLLYCRVEQWHLTMVQKLCEIRSFILKWMGAITLCFFLNSMVKGYINTKLHLLSILNYIFLFSCKMAYPVSFYGHHCNDMYSAL